jgi:plastocyanin
MNHRPTFLIGAAVMAWAVALPTMTTARSNDKDKDNAKAAAVQDATVNFGQPQNQTPDAAPVGASVTHFLMPNDVTIHKGGTVTFVVNGGGHGIAIHPVSKETTREDIAEDLCDGATPENADPIVDRRSRAAVCNGTAATPATIDGVPVTVIGTQNLDYTITDGNGHLVIQPGFNVNFPATATTPAIVKNNPRLDDTEHTVRLFATSGRPPAGESNVTALNAAGLATGGGFLTGSAPAVAPATVGTPGNRIQVRFTKTGRYLVICMNRAHSLNDHMFGFVNVVGDDDN